MSRRMRNLNTIIKHVYTEPKTVAQIQWSADHPSVGMQLEQQVGWHNLQHYVATGQHPDPDIRVSIVQYDEPDWDWWEPRYDQPWRREQARDRELDRLLDT